MKIACLGDLHATSVQPKKRLDNYWETWKDKFSFILQYCADRHIETILQPGDLFDSHKASDLTKQIIIDMLLSYDLDMYCVYGQHDMRYHNSDREDTPTKVLQSSQAIVVIENNDRLAITENEVLDVNHRLYVGICGASWNEDIPKTEFERAIKILVTHRMVIKDEKLWFGQESYTTTNWLFENTDFDLIVCGDNHASFSASKGDRHIVNCGSMMRKRTDQDKHEPCFYIYDTADKSITKIMIPIKPFSEVMDMEEVSKEKADESRFQKLIEELNKESDIEGLDYVKNMYHKIKNGKFKPGVVSFLEEVMG